MAEPINGVNRGDAVGATSATQAGSPSPMPRSDAVAPGAGNDSADVSKTEALLQTIVQAGAGASSVDEARVNSLRDAIEAGNFQPHPQQIAQKLIEWEDMLAGGKTAP